MNQKQEILTMFEQPLKVILAHFPCTCSGVYSGTSIFLTDFLSSYGMRMQMTSALTKEMTLTGE